MNVKNLNKYKNNIQVFATNDTSLINDYVNIRRLLINLPSNKYQDLFLNYNLDSFDEANNPSSSVIVGTINEICFGGCRIIHKNSNSDFLLPGVETLNFKLNKIFPNLNKPKVVYAELSRLAILPNYIEYTETLCDGIYDFCVNSRINYLIWISSIQRLRIYNKICKKYKSELKIFNDIVLPKKIGSSKKTTKKIAILDFSNEYKNFKNGEKLQHNTNNLQRG